MAAGSSDKQVKVELLWWQGCPSWERALAHLESTAQELGSAEVEIVRREIKTDDEAQQERFLGSPTILVDGQDIVPQGPTDSVGLNCRIYYKRNGRVSPIPDKLDIRDAILNALKEEANSNE